MAGGYPEQRIISALRTAASGILQMRLAPMADRDLAIALEGLVSEDRESLLRLLPEAKARRVAQEREYLARLKISPIHRRLMVERLADALEGRRTDRGGTWIAPGDNRRR